MSLYLSNRRRAVAAILSAAVALWIPACGDDDTTDPSADTLLGSWNATSFVLDGTELIDADSSVLLALEPSAPGSTSGSFAIYLVGVPELCDETDCIPTGTFDITDGQLVFDAGTPEEIAFDTSLSGGVLTLAFTAPGGGAVVATFVRVTPS